MSPFAAARGLFVDALVRTVWGVRAQVIERPAARAALRAIGRPAIWLMHSLAGRAPPGPAGGGLEPVLHLPLNYPVAPLGTPPSTAVLVHAYYVEVLPELVASLENLPYPADVFVSTDTEAKREAALAALSGWPGAVEVRITPNRGRNIAPQLIGFRDVFARYELLLLLHTKRSVHTAELEGWRDQTLESLLPSPAGVRGVYEAFARLPKLGVVAPRTFPFVRRHMIWGENFPACRALGERMGFALYPDSALDFPAGAMFWARSSALKPLLDLNLAYKDFELEAGQKDGTLAHAIERLVFHACETAGMRWIHAGTGDRIQPPERIFHAEEVQGLRRVLTDQGRTVLLPGRAPRPTLTPAEAAAAPGEAQRKAAFRDLCREELDAFLASGERLTLPTSTTPEVSVLLVLFNQAELTYQCLRSLAFALDRPSEVIVLDNASSDRTSDLLDRLDGVRVIRSPENLHFLRGVNLAAGEAKGEALLLLNNDTRVRPGSVAAACSRLEQEPDLGAVGGKIVLLDGTLQEAGSIIWRDGSAVGHGRGADPWQPDFQFRRDVDYCSAAFLMVRRDLFERLGRFDEAFAPAYYEETDLCMRIRGAGFRVAYDPAIEVLHFEFGSSESSAAALELQSRHRDRFVERHRAVLDAEHLPPQAPQLDARIRPPPKRRLLIVEDQVPYRHLGAGYPRANELLHAAHAAGWFVTFYPAFHPDADWTTAYAAVPPDVEIAAERGRENLAQFMHERVGFYDAAIVSRPHNMEPFARALRQVPQFLTRDRIIYDAEAIFAARDAKGSPAAVAAELALARDTAAVFAVNAAEAASFRAAGCGNVRVLGHGIEAQPSRTGFAPRRDVLFVGALDEDNSPNSDSLVFFVGEVMPKLDRLIGTDWVLKVAGRSAAPTVQALASPRVQLLGMVPDLAPLYGKARLFIAPTRFAAGTPMKVHEAAARGLPVVATSLLAGQLGWSDGRELLVADKPADFAGACARLYRDAELWTAIRKQALAAVKRDCSPAAFAAVVRETLEGIPLRP
ncbi:rhamnan synthesis F family protein [Phenylobacterium sp.]|uniref:rhamnan synthesis F family protein n=1 Tax=Phenylobacterium sp. TaxID=1871053 RepID=UPI002F94F1FE